MKRAFKIKIIFVIFKGVSIVKNCRRPKSKTLNFLLKALDNASGTKTWI